MLFPIFHRLIDNNSSMNYIFRRLLTAFLVLLLIIATGTTGYYFLSAKQPSVTDSFFMTIITITTIGFGEVIEYSNHTAGRLFTVFIAFSGIGAFTYIVSNITAFTIGGEILKTFKTKRMMKMIQKLSSHYIICGSGDIGLQIASELIETKRPFLLLDKTEPAQLQDSTDKQTFIFLKGDATDEGTLCEAGIKNAAGVFAVTGDDNYNLVITLTAKQINPSVRVVAKAKDAKHSQKLKQVGADAVISPNLIGGLRMASEMFRPTVVSFLDTMLRDKDKNLRVEEITPSRRYKGKALSELKLGEYRDVLLLALKRNDAWIFNPEGQERLAEGDTLIVMISADARNELNTLLTAE